MTTIQLNKLFLTFTPTENVEEIVEKIKSSYTILYNKIFIFEIEDSNEFAVTYNVECGNINSIPLNTILIHRHKENKILYSLDALNVIVLEQNNGIFDKNYKVNWSYFKNNILTSKNNKLNIQNIKLYDIIHV